MLYITQQHPNHYCHYPDFHKNTMTYDSFHSEHALDTILYQSPGSILSEMMMQAVCKKCLPSEAEDA